MKKRDLDLIWRYTHPDFRGEMYGIRYVLHHVGSFGTCSVPLESLPKKDMFERLAYALRAKKRGEPGWK
jgi:hypothetical protein